ncbi:MAG: hypothetical protein NW217_12070 [Hyphomicrobiaceae bacterium]|nr:hypothetical protein [Hyphomicrobiaceae bacterium]
MLGYLILVALQIVAAWYGEPQISRFLPGGFGAVVNDCIEAAIYAVIVWMVGLVASFVLQDVKTPGSSTLVSALVGALIGVAIVYLLPMAGIRLPSGINKEFIPLAGAVLGYLARR